MSKVFGFSLVEQREIPEIASKAEVFVHDATGAQVLCLRNDDENKVFGASFRTPPVDSTGIAHILEHSVLCGSEKYPVKEPFVELLKGSMQTFLNAMTYPDKTCYPVASTNEQDFFNLMGVYLDAVFFPNLTERTLMQEGWHYELDDPSDDMTFKGVVFNEMKGVYSSPDSLLSEYSQQSLFPDATYGLDSGGDPERIPDLTFEQFMEFHRRYYHPSNGYFFFHGNGDRDAQLKALAEYLDRFERIEPDSAVRLQRRMEGPFMMRRSYAASEKGENSSMATLNFLLPEIGGPELRLGLEMLEHILIGMPSSPLRKKLLDSGLGEDLTGIGLEDELRQMYFSVGLKNMSSKSLNSMELVIMQTLRRMAESRIDADMVEAAINTIEFELRENNTGAYPRGLSLMLRGLTTWLHGGDPLSFLGFEAPLNRIKARIAEGERYFENLIQAHFIENKHCSTVLLEPDPDLEKAREKKESDRLAAARREMSDDDIKDVVRLTEELREHQGAPDAPEDLATIPRLEKKDLDPAHSSIPAETIGVAGNDMLCHPLVTNSIVYLDAGFDCSGLPERLLPYLPVFGTALVETGTRSEDFESLTRRIARKTGGIDPHALVTGVRDSDAARALLFLRGKCASSNTPDMVDIMCTVLREAKLSDRDRIRQIVLEAKSSMERRLVPAGHSFAASRLKARFSKAGEISERLNGVSQLFFLRDLARKVDNDFGMVLADLEGVRAALLSKSGLALNLTCDEALIPATTSELTGFVDMLPDVSRETEPLGSSVYPEAEALTVPAQVNYVAKGANVYEHGFTFSGSAHVAARMLRNSYLWDRVRVQGGAYGSFCLFDRTAGSLCLVSYRDPNLDKTLDIYNQAGEYYMNLELDADELTKSIIGTFSDLDAHMLPDAKGFASLVRSLSGEDDEFLQTVRDQVLATGPQDFKAFGEALKMVAEHGDVVVLGSGEACEKSAISFNATPVM